MIRKCEKNSLKPTKCKKDVYENWNYCKEHGCKNCKKVVKKTKGGIAIENEFWACGVACKNELVAAENKRRAENLLNLNDEIIKRLRVIWNSEFFVELKKLINELFFNKCLVINNNDKTSIPIITLSPYLEAFQGFIEVNKILSLQEKEEWKKFYEENKDEDIRKLTEMEEEFLFRLITKRKKQDDNIRERERESKKQITSNYSGYRNWIRQSSAGEDYWTRPSIS